jgi:hypothetical protein
MEREKAYNLMIKIIKFEYFSGKMAFAVKQDFHAKVFLMTLRATYAHPIENKVVEEYKANENRKFDQKINRTNAVFMTQDILIAKKTETTLFNELHTIMIVTK